MKFHGSVNREAASHFSYPATVRNHRTNITTNSAVLRCKSWRKSHKTNYIYGNNNNTTFQKSTPTSITPKNCTFFICSLASCFQVHIPLCTLRATFIPDMPYLPESILITGGAGFIASHVAILLAKKYPQYQVGPTNVHHHF